MIIPVNLFVYVYKYNTSVTSVKKLFVRDLYIAIFWRLYSFAFESPPFRN